MLHQKTIPWTYRDVSMRPRYIRCLEHKNGSLHYPRLHEMKQQLNEAERVAEEICKANPGQMCAVAWDYVLEMHEAIDRIVAFDEDLMRGEHEWQ